MTLEALGAAAERGDRAFAHFVGAQSGDQSETAAFFRRGGARRSRTGGGRTSGAGYLDDYANVAHGLIELHTATGELRWLEEAHRRATLDLGVAVRGVIGMHTTVMHKQHKPQRGQRDCANEKRIHPNDTLAIQNLISERIPMERALLVGKPASDLAHVLPLQRAHPIHPLVLHEPRPQHVGAGFLPVMTLVKEYPW